MSPIFILASWYEHVSAEQIKEVLKSDAAIRSLAEVLYQQKSILVMGRGYNYATCLEGALVKTHCYLLLHRKHSIRLRIDCT